MDLQCNDSLGTSGFLSVTDKGWFRRSLRRWAYLYASTVRHIDLWILSSKLLYMWYKYFILLKCWLTFIQHSPFFYLFCSLQCHWAWIFIPVCLFWGAAFTWFHCFPEEKCHLWKISYQNGSDNSGDKVCEVREAYHSAIKILLSENHSPRFCCLPGILTA